MHYFLEINSEILFNTIYNTGNPPQQFRDIFDCLYNENEKGLDWAPILVVLSYLCTNFGTFVQSVTIIPLSDGSRYKTNCDFETAIPHYIDGYLGGNIFRIGRSREAKWYCRLKIAISLYNFAEIINLRLTQTASTATNCLFARHCI